MTKKKRENKEGSGVGIADRKKVEPPKKYNVVLLNDDYTPMNFVSDLLQRLFHKPATEAEQITLLVHNTGKGIAGTYSREIAETKAYEVKINAVNSGYPLIAEIQPE